MAKAHIIGDGDCAKALRSLIRADKDLALGHIAWLAAFTATIDETAPRDTISIDVGARASRLELRTVAHIGPLLPNKSLLVQFGSGVRSASHVVIRVPQHDDGIHWAVAHGMYRAMLDERNQIPLE